MTHTAIIKLKENIFLIYFKKYSNNATFSLFLIDMTQDCKKKSHYCNFAKFILPKFFKYDKNLPNTIIFSENTVKIVSKAGKTDCTSM